MKFLQDMKIAGRVSWSQVKVVMCGMEGGAKLSQEGGKSALFVAAS